MSFEEFKTKIANLIKVSAEKVIVNFDNDTERGLYTARVSNGVIITAHPSGLRMSVSYGDGHLMQASV